jgi:hypothetical protein
MVQDYVCYWSVLNDGENGEIWVWPTPSTANEMEWLVYCIPKDLYTDSDYDAIPDGFKDAIKFKAASLAYMTSRQFSQAQMMEDLFKEALGTDRQAVDAGKHAGGFYYSNI